LINFSDIEAFIFDNDGVLVNSEVLSCGALHDLFLEEFNVEIGNDFSSVIGTSDIHAITYYAGIHGISLEQQSMERLIEKKQALYIATASEELQSFPYLLQALTQLSTTHELAVASSGNLEKIRFSLTKVQLLEFFPTICSATEVKHGKPAPDLFFLAAKKLGIPPPKCVVIEDSEKGIQAAKSAGMFAIGFTSSFPEQTLVDAGADICIKSYAELLELI
jgi:HAD superfamily hydrolase (TIGR01509 family)